MFQTTVNVEGMMCGHCEAHVNDAIKNTISPKEVKSSHKDNKTVILSEEKPDEEVIKKAIDEAGYKVSGITVEEVEAKKKFLGLF